MSKPVGVVDLFSGPGGLGEGFSACKNGEAFSIEVSIEKEASAHATLTLRSFLRKFEGSFPSDYYEFLNKGGDEPNWPRLYPKQWQAAENECRHLELGTQEASSFLNQRIADIHKKYGSRTLLIGGPPCQAYSLVGRSRNAGTKGYVAYEDKRHFLYEQYVKVLSTLHPAVFIMENVRGMLTSSVRGQRIYQNIVSDLQSACGEGSYRLYALSPVSEATRTDLPAPTDFIIRAEEHGVPQARHRVIIVGIRTDLATRLPSDALPKLLPQGQKASVFTVIGEMPYLRSGLSKGDGQYEWKCAVQYALQKVRIATEGSALWNDEAFRQALQKCDEKWSGSAELLRHANRGTAIPDDCHAPLSNWLTDNNLVRLPNNETRGHMREDLVRYLFAAVFGEAFGYSPKAEHFPKELAPNHKNWESGKFADRFRVQTYNKPSTTITSHISKDGHYFIHPDPTQCRSLTVREAARLQTFPDNYYFKGNRTQQYVQVGNAVPPFLAKQIAEAIYPVFSYLNDIINS